MDVPKNFGNYQFLRLLDSHKRFCSVFVAHEVSTLHEYACKLFSRADPFFQLVEQEIRVHQMLHHPHIASIHEVIYMESAIIVVMEFYAKGDLFSQAKKLSPSQKNSIFIDVVDAVAYLHSHGVSHLDIKPDNIFVDDNYGAQLADFGSCETEVTRNKKFINLGTLDYRAPEMFKVTPGDHRPADIWSLGILLYALSTGSLPWLIGTDESVEEQILEGRITYCTFLPQQIIDVIDRCCTYEPSMRITADQLKEILKDFQIIQCNMPLKSKKSRNRMKKIPKTIELHKGSYHSFHCIPKMTIVGALPSQRVMKSTNQIEGI